VCSGNGGGRAFRSSFRLRRIRNADNKIINGPRPRHGYGGTIAFVTESSNRSAASKRTKYRAAGTQQRSTCRRARVESPVFGTIRSIGIRIFSLYVRFTDVRVYRRSIFERTTRLNFMETKQPKTFKRTRDMKRRIIEKRVGYG